MNDIFVEQLVKRNSTTKDTVMKAGAFVLAFIITMAAFTFIPSFAMFIMIAAFFGAWFATSFFKIEYEYILTNGEMDIDCVYNKSRRKRLHTFRLSDVEIMAHIEDNNHKNSFNSAEQIKDFSSGETKENTFCLLVKLNGKNTKVIIEPNDNMMNNIKRYITPRKLFLPYNLRK